MRACSSVVERVSYKDEVVGSIPTTPTLFCPNEIDIFGSLERTENKFSIVLVAKYKDLKMVRLHPRPFERAVSSVAERFLDTEEAAGPIPALPIN